MAIHPVFLLGWSPCPLVDPPDSPGAPRGAAGWGDDVERSAAETGGEATFSTCLMSVTGERWVWINTYRYIFSGMNIHLPAILMFTRGIGFWPIPISAELVIFLIFGFRKWWSNGEMQIHPVTGEKNNHESPVIAGGYMIFQWQWMRDDEYNGALSVMDLLEIKDWCIEHSDKF